MHLGGGHDTAGSFYKQTCVSSVCVCVCNAEQQTITWYCVSAVLFNSKGPRSPKRCIAQEVLTDEKPRKSSHTKNPRSPNRRKAPRHPNRFETQDVLTDVKSEEVLRDVNPRRPNRCKAQEVVTNVRAQDVLTDEKPKKF